MGVSRTVKSLANELNAFVSRYGLNHLKVFGDFLDYIIAWFNPVQAPMSGWTYDDGQTASFREMMYGYFQLMDEHLKTESWYDAWGDLFMELVGNFAGYRGQFFTPMSLTSALADIMRASEMEGRQCGAFGTRVVINDPACGSSRTLLAAHIQMVSSGAAAPYLIGEDLDFYCVKMSAINMCVHGCFGEVICHNSLEEPDAVRQGYIINEGMYPFPGIPTIREVRNPARFIACRHWMAARSKA